MKAVTGPGLEELPARLCDGRGGQHGVLAGRCVSVGAGAPLALPWQCECDHFCACHVPSEPGIRLSREPSYVRIRTHYHSRQQRQLGGPLSQFVPLTLDYHHRSGEEVHILTSRRAPVICSAVGMLTFPFASRHSISGRI